MKARDPNPQDLGGRQKRCRGLGQGETPASPAEPARAFGVAAWFLEALDLETLAILGRAALRRLG